LSTTPHRPHAQTVDLTPVRKIRGSGAQYNWDKCLSRRGDLSLALHREAPDRSCECAAVFDRQQRRIGIVPDALVVRIERSAIGRVGSSEGRHRNSTGISLPLEELIKIGILEDPQSHAHVNHTRDPDRQCCAVLGPSACGTR
jgi:hypothetical protein